MAEFSSKSSLSLLFVKLRPELVELESLLTLEAGSWLVTLRSVSLSVDSVVFPALFC